MEKENIYTLPNAISLYRLLMFPVILLMAYLQKESLFATLICINLVTDILDGLLARMLKQETRFGAALDNLADLGTYILACCGIVRFKPEEFEGHYFILFIFLLVLAASNIVSWARFGKMPGLHLYSCVIAAYLQGIFFFLLFAKQLYLPLYYFSVGFGILAYCEKTIILFLIPEIRPKLKGLFWILKK
ncbi:MAG: phosphatidylglycerophosphate synthase [Bacteroidetes bacterium]|nr:phosphatidylglycerophosphate synthase [Bacteroidota bacterium]